MADKFIGKWNLVDSENFDEYMKKVGVGLITRKMATTLKPVLTIESTGDHWKMTSASTFKTSVTEFDIGKEFEEETPDGRKMKSVFNFEGDKLIQQQKAIKPSDKDSTFERYIEGDKFVVVCKCEDVTSKRTYQRA